MNFRCRDLNLKVFEFSVDEVQDAIKIVSDYEKANNTAVRCFEKETGKRIIGGTLQKNLKINLENRQLFKNYY